MKRNKKALLAGLGAALLLTSTLVGCGNQPSGGSEVNSVAASTTAAKKDSIVVALSAGSEPASLDPCTGSWGHGTSPIIQSTLVRYDDDKNIAYDLATDYRMSEDGLTWTFTIRNDAKFTDGQPVTAKDVAFTLLTAKDGGSGLDLTRLKDVKVTGDSTVEVILNQPWATFINTCCSIGIVPEHAYGADYGTKPIGSGAYKLVEWKKGEQILLTRNDDYYGDKAKIKDVTLTFMSEDAAVAACQAGKLDVAATSATLADTKISGMHLEEYKTMDNRGLTLPMTPNTGEKTADGYPIGNDVTSDIAIRHALAYGISREEIAQNALNGHASPCYSENDGAPWCNTEAVQVEYDLEKAKKLLEDAGWTDTDGDGIREKDGLKASFTVLYTAGDSMRQAIGMATAEQAKKLGIEITVKGESWDDITADQFSNAVLMGWGSVNPYTSYSLFHSSGKLKTDYYNPEGMDNKTVDEHLDKAIRATSLEETYKELKLAQWDGTTGTAMKADCPWVWLINHHHNYFVRDGLNIGAQNLHAHGHSWSLVENLPQWSWNDSTSA